MLQRYGKQSVRQNFPPIKYKGPFTPGKGILCSVIDKSVYLTTTLLVVSPTFTTYIPLGMGTECAFPLYSS